MCQCSTLPDSVSFPDCQPLLESLRRIGAATWCHLYLCSDCEALWVVDIADKYKPQLAIRVPAGSNWQDFDTTVARKDFLLRARGGLGEGKCQWHDCWAPPVRGVAYCHDHLYATGVGA